MLVNDSNRPHQIIYIFGMPAGNKCFMYSHAHFGKCFGGQPKELTERTVRLLAERVMPAVRSARKAA